VEWQHECVYLCIIWVTGIGLMNLNAVVPLDLIFYLGAVISRGNDTGQSKTLKVDVSVYTFWSRLRPWRGFFAPSGHLSSRTSFLHLNPASRFHSRAIHRRVRDFRSDTRTYTHTRLGCRHASSCSQGGPLSTSPAKVLRCTKPQQPLILPA